MVIILLFLLIGFCIGFRIGGIEDGLILAFPMIFFGLMISFLTGAIISPTVEHTEVVDLVCLSDNYSVDGDFYLGCGHIEGELKYTYLYEEEGKGYTIGTIDANQSYIYVQDSDLPAQLKIITHNHSTRNWIFLDVPKVEYSLYIPQDSIAYGFNIDLQ